jgi:hypothetical protein
MDSEVKLINGVDLGTLSNATGIRFNDLLQLAQLERLHTLFIDNKYYVSKSTVEFLKLKKKEGVEILSMLDHQ